jgi:uncharacterized protein YjbI with pentapeptide repeats
LKYRQTIAGVAMTFRGVSLAILFIAVMLSSAPRAHACSCERVTDPDAFVSQVGAIFEGELVAETRVEKGLWGGPAIEGTFRVFTAYKGAIGPSTRVLYTGGDGASCGVSFQVGKKVTVVAFGDDIRGYRAGLCGQAAAANGRDEILAAAARYRDRLQILHKMSGFQRPWAKNQEAQFLAANNEPAPALALIDDILKEKSLRRPATLLAADLNVAVEQDEAALTRLEAYLADNPYDHEIRQYRVRQLMRLGRSEQVPANWRDFANLHTDELTFHDRDLAGATFRDAHAQRGDFARANLDHADLSGAKIYKADFSDAVLQGANLRKAQLRGTATGASLANASLAGARLALDLTDANLENADASGATLEQPGSLSKAKASRLVAVGASFDLRDFNDGDFHGADFSGAHFSSPNFRDADLRNVDFAGATFGSHSEPGDLSGADLTGARLDRVSFSPTVYDCRTRWPAGFDPAQFTNLIAAPDAEACGTKRDFSWLRPQDGRVPDVSFANLDLAGVSFRGSVLPGNTFIAANLRGADFSRANGGHHVWLYGADLTDAKFNFVDLRQWQFEDGRDRIANLTRTDFRGATLYLHTIQIKEDKFLDFSQAALSGAVFADAPEQWPAATIDPIKAGIVFRQSSQAAKIYPGYSLRNVDLRGFDLFQFDLSALDLSGADLRGARLEQTDLSSANLDGAKLKGACRHGSVKWPPNFDLAASGMIFCGRVTYSGGPGTDGYTASAWAHSEGGLKQGPYPFYFPPEGTAVPDLAGENWDEANWLAAWLPGSNMSKGSFVHATLKAANLTGAKLAQADLSGADLRDALLDDADLSGASLERADLRLTSLKGATLTGADLTGALYDDKTVWPDGFDPDKAGAQRE